jgi:CRISPR-associated protein Cmr4
MVYIRACATDAPSHPQIGCHDRVAGDTQGTRRAKGSTSRWSDSLIENGRIYLEDLDFTVIPSADAARWAEKIAGWVFPDDTTWQDVFKKRFAVLPDVVFDFLTETGTEVHTRVKISDETKTVQSGMLWTEESLPAETILAGVVACDRVFGRDGKDMTPHGLLDTFAKTELNLQIGGKAKVGRGQVRCVFSHK